MRIVPLKRWHLEHIDMQEAQKYVSRWATPEILSVMESTLAFAAVEDMRVLGCAGVIEMWEGRAAAWAWLARDIGMRFVGMHRAVKNFLDGTDIRRIEATVDMGHAEGERWIKLLGFHLETPCMKGYMPDGGDASMYVRGI